MSRLTEDFDKFENCSYDSFRENEEQTQEEEEEEACLYEDHILEDEELDEDEKGYAGKIPDIDYGSSMIVAGVVYNLKTHTDNEDIFRRIKHDPMLTPEDILQLKDVIARKNYGLVKKVSGKTCKSFITHVSDYFDVAQDAFNRAIETYNVDYVGPAPKFVTSTFSNYAYNVMLRACLCENYNKFSKHYNETWSLSNQVNEDQTLEDRLTNPYAETPEQIEARKCLDVVKDYMPKLTIMERFMIYEVRGLSPVAAYPQKTISIYTGVSQGAVSGFLKDATAKLKGCICNNPDSVPKIKL